MKIKMYDLVVCEGCDDLHVSGPYTSNDDTSAVGTCKLRERRGCFGAEAQDVPVGCPRMREHVSHVNRKDRLRDAIVRLREL